MKISYLIRRGCSRYPQQAFNTGFDFIDGTEDLKACVRAAAHVGFSMETGSDLLLETKNPEPGVTIVQSQAMYDDGHPLNVALRSIKVKLKDMPNGVKRSDKEFSLERAITILNDDLRWSREEIADWVERSGYDKPVKEAVRGSSPSYRR